MTVADISYTYYYIYIDLIGHIVSPKVSGL